MTERLAGDLPAADGDRHDGVRDGGAIAGSGVHASDVPSSATARRLQDLAGRMTAATAGRLRPGTPGGVPPLVSLSPVPT